MILSREQAHGLVPGTGVKPVLRGEALQCDMKHVLGLPGLPAWLQALPPDDECIARHWADVRAFATAPELDDAANELRRQALAWAEQRVEPGCDLDLLPRLGYPTVDIVWLRDGVEAYFAGLPRLLLVCGLCPYAAAAGGATRARLATSHMGWSRTSGVTLVLQDMQRTLRVPMLPPEWELLGKLPTYLYNLWPSLRAVLRDAESQAERQAAAAASLTAQTPFAPAEPDGQVHVPARVEAAAAQQSLPLQFLLMTVVAVRLGLTTPEYSRPGLRRESSPQGGNPAPRGTDPGLDGTNRADTGHNTQQTARGRDPAPCHT